ncbi:GNAT family N-acetyltransferase [Legionella longbeachae]|uniref:N-acetyltransferase domain-containing protein n=2 Tax=Legionella longbeachae TaxID=450 RepID=D3HMH7_LEGLN|nr:GNAT family N-acetyltransferase [Legionella longbeachae]VEE04086.1 Predicted acetyltransferase [Legionella oakridgensis]HBD7396945.1 GNAT family N-acetyltransferase [Legionella pneumophila]ARB93067.1 N-acetyltransferase [Legionella longbeachae]ARM33871.1 GNAT family N-acetyltransferase [Legionella longbeachae]EEZ96943.1 GCN5-related N-acetyltransferase-like protein [Legionella longbeachae D-4968]
MKQISYTSKKLGSIVIESRLNQYTIFSNRLEARSLNQDDEHFLIDKYTQLLKKPENINMFGEGKIWQPSTVKEFIQDETKCWNSGNKFSVFSIYHSGTQEFIGYLHIKHSLNDFAAIGIGHQNVAEIAYIIDQAFWGKGYGTEIAILGKKFIKHIISESADETLEKNIKEIAATVHPSNEGSKRILQKTLKQMEPEEFTKFGDQPRLLFFKPLKTDVSLLDNSNTLTAKL